MSGTATQLHALPVVLPKTSEPMEYKRMSAGSMLRSHSVGLVPSIAIFVFGISGLGSCEPVIGRVVQHLSLLREGVYQRRDALSPGARGTGFALLHVVQQSGFA